MHPHHPAPRTVFDPALLLAALDTKRRNDNISWRELARRARMPHSYGIAGKLRRGAHPTAGVLLLLLDYLGDTDLGPYRDAGGPDRQAPAA